MQVETVRPVRVSGGWAIERTVTETRTPPQWRVEYGPDGIACRMVWRGPQEPYTRIISRRMLLGVWPTREAALKWIEPTTAPPDAAGRLPS